MTEDTQLGQALSAEGWAAMLEDWTAMVATPGDATVLDAPVVRAAAAQLEAALRERFGEPVVAADDGD